MAKKEEYPDPWKTVTLGIHRSANAYFHSIVTKQKCAPDDWTRDVMAGIRYSRKPRAVELFRLLDTDDLGFTKRYHIADVVRAVEAKGYRKCQPQVAPALRDQYGDQPVGERLLIFTDPVMDSVSIPGLFGVAHYPHGLFLCMTTVYDEKWFDLGTHWVVCRPAVRVRSQG